MNEAPICELCERCGSEGRIYEYIVPHAPSGRFDPDERDLGECSTCHGEGLVYLPGVRRSKWDVFALQDHFDEAFAALAPAPDQGSSGNPAEIEGANE